MKLGWLTLGHSPSPEEDYLTIEQQLEQACCAELRAIDVEHVLCQMSFGYLPHERIKSSM